MSARVQAVQRLTELVEIAKEAKGWGVNHGATQVYFIPPNSSREEAISTSVHPGELHLKRLEKALAARGLPMERPKNPAHPDGPPALPEAVAPPQGPAQDEPEIEPLVPDLTCPECAAEGEEYTAKSNAGLSAHRRGKHGVVGTSRDAIRKRAKKAQESSGEPVPDASAPTSLQDAQEAVMADVDAAWLLLRGEVEKVVEGLHDAESVATWQRRAEEAGDTLAGVRHAIQTMPMAKAYAVIAELVGADRE